MLNGDAYPEAGIEGLSPTMAEPNAAAGRRGLTSQQLSALLRSVPPAIVADEPELPLADPALAPAEPRKGVRPSAVVELQVLVRKSIRTQLRVKTAEDEEEESLRAPALRAVCSLGDAALDRRAGISGAAAAVLSQTPTPAWPEIVNAADYLRGKPAVSKSLLGEACIAMGRALNRRRSRLAIVSAQPAEHFRSTPGGYFHGMVAKAKTGELNLARRSGFYVTPPPRNQTGPPAGQGAAVITILELMPGLAAA